MGSGALNIITVKKIIETQKTHCRLIYMCGSLMCRYRKFPENSRVLWAGWSLNPPKHRLRLPHPSAGTVYIPAARHQGSKCQIVLKYMKRSTRPSKRVCIHLSPQTVFSRIRRAVFASACTRVFPESRCTMPGGSASSLP